MILSSHKPITWASREILHYDCKEGKPVYVYNSIDNNAPNGLFRIVARVPKRLLLHRQG